MTPKVFTGTQTTMSVFLIKRKKKRKTSWFGAGKQNTLQWAVILADSQSRHDLTVVSLNV